MEKKTNILKNEWFKKRLLEFCGLLKMIYFRYPFNAIKTQMIFFLTWMFIYPIPRLIFGTEKACKICHPFLNNYFPPTILPLAPLLKNKILLRDRIDFGTYIEIHIYNIYFKELLKQGMNVIDIGAHIGTYTTFAAEKIGSTGKVISIEPESRNYNQLCQNIELNKFKNVISKNIALSDHAGLQKLYVSNTYSGRHSLIFKQDENSYSEVQVKTLDSLLEELNVKKVDIIKIDTEGSEISILKGAEKTLKNNPGIKILVAAEHYLSQAQEVCQFLNKKGFKTAVSRERTVMTI